MTINGSIRSRMSTLPGIIKLVVEQFNKNNQQAISGEITFQ